MEAESGNRVMLAFVFSLLLVLDVSALESSANPSVPPPPASTFIRLSDPVYGIAWLFLVNVLVNLFCFAALLLVLIKRQDVEPKILETTAPRFLSALICALAVVSLIGAAVDFYLLTQPRYIVFQTGMGPADGIYRVIVFNIVNWTLALCVIFASILAASFIVLRLETRVALGIAVGFIFVNLIYWVFIDTFGEDTTFLTIIFGAISAPLVIRALLQWYVSERRVRVQPSPAPSDSVPGEMRSP